MLVITKSGTAYATDEIHFNIDNISFTTRSGHWITVPFGELDKIKEINYED